MELKIRNMNNGSIEVVVASLKTPDERKDNGKTWTIHVK